MAAGDLGSYWTHTHLSRRRMLRGAAAGGLGLTAAALIGCGAGDEENGGTAPTTAATTTPAPQLEDVEGTGVNVGVQPTAVSGLDTPDEFVIATEGEVADLDPFNAFTGYSGWGQMIARSIYQTLFELRITLDESGGIVREWAPMLVESYERPEPERWILHLRPDVTFHNGELWNAEAAVASYDFFRSPDVLEATNRTDRFKEVTRFEAVDELTLEVESPNSEVWERFRTSYHAIPQSIATGDWQSLGTDPVGTGPFRLREFARGSHTIVEQFPEYWGASSPVPYVGMPSYQSIRWLPRPEATVRTLTVETGESHMAFNVGAGNAVPRLEHWIAGGGFQTTMIRLNNVIEPTNDIRVRQAINMAIDRDSLASEVFLGTARPTTFFSFHPVEIEPFPYNPEEARQLLDAAGYSGQELELVWGELRIPEEEQLAPLYFGYLGEVGLNVRLSRQDAIAYNDIGGREWPDQPAMFLETSSSGNSGILGGIRDKLGCEGSGTYCNEEIEQLQIDMQQQEGDEFNESLSRVANLAKDDASRAWICAVQLVHGVAPFVDGSRLPRNTYIRPDELDFAV